MKCYFMIIFLALGWLVYPARVTAEKVFFTGYKDGFYIRPEEEGEMALRLGGTFHFDYRHYGEEARADNGFDVRRARLALCGQLTKWFRFGLEYEFQGNRIKHLVDAYGEVVIKGRHGLRLGQFKEPFSMEWQTREKGLYFAERSMGYYLGPKRDIGVMLYGSFYGDSVNYATGLFNGNGVDGSSGGERDDPEIAARLVISPFKTSSANWLRHFQFGGSATYARIDLSDVNLEVKSTGMAGSGRNLYELKQNTKFGVLLDVEDRVRTALETGWAWGPLAVLGEYIQMKYKEVKPSGRPPRDADLSSWYLSFLYCLTGEEFVLTKSVTRPLYPEKFLNPAEGTYGAVVLAARAEHFSGDGDWIKENAFVSIREADAYSFAINWIPHQMLRIILDYTYTDFTDPIRVRVNPDGDVDYVDKESVFTFRFSIDF